MHGWFSQELSKCTDDFNGLIFEMHGWFSPGKVKFEKFYRDFEVKSRLKVFFFILFFTVKSCNKCHRWYSKYTPAFKGWILKCYGWNLNFSVNFTNNIVKFVKSTVKLTNIRVKFSKKSAINLNSSFSRHSRLQFSPDVIAVRVLVSGWNDCRSRPA